MSLDFQLSDGHQSVSLKSIFLQGHGIDQGLVLGVFPLSLFLLPP